jgi:glycosyltransferase involved in cell wall biosynthesis
MVQLDARGYDKSIFDRIEHLTIFPEAMLSDAERHIESVVATQPDVVVVSGWMLPAYGRLMREPRLANARFVVAIDEAWSGTIKQRAAAVLHGGYLRRMSLLVGAGERTRVFARHAGVADSRVRVGLYCCDDEAFSPAITDRRNAGAWPRRFLFAGRLRPEKGIEVLIEGYSRYRRSTGDPWSLSICGKGPLEGLVSGRDGVELLGFVQPASLPRTFAEHGAFILPSREEPWGVVIAEACAAGLPVACSERCGASLDLVRDYSNGIVFSAGDPDGVRDALLYLHRNESRLPEMGALSSTLVLPFSARHWARRWAEYLLTAVATDR